MHKSCLKVYYSMQKIFDFDVIDFEVFGFEVFDFKYEASKGKNKPSLHFVTCMQS